MWLVVNYLTDINPAGEKQGTRVGRISTTTAFLLRLLLDGRRVPSFPTMAGKPGPTLTGSDRRWPSWKLVPVAPAYQRD